MNVEIAWRNIWRNPRRTGVILIAVVIGVWSMIFLGALMRGILAGMIHNGINTLTGHIQIQQTHYPQDPSIDYRIADPAGIEPILAESLPAGSQWTQRVRVNAVVNNARHNKGAILVGIDPEKEARLSFIGTAVTQGRYLKAGEANAVVVGRAPGRAVRDQAGTQTDRDVRRMPRAALPRGPFASGASFRRKWRPPRKAIFS